MTLGGYFGDYAPADDVGFVEFARSLQKSEIFEVIRSLLHFVIDNRRTSPSMRRPVSVKRVFPSSSCGSLPCSQAASVATLPFALFCERCSLGASWVFSIQ